MPKAPDALTPGTKAPVFALPDQHGEMVRLTQFRGRPVVLYFYPKDDTEDCTTQACDFTRRFPKFEKVGAAVLGISRLDLKSKARFGKKHGITIPLLADESTEVSESYGVLVEKSMYGKKYKGIVRTTFLIDGDGRITARWDVTDVEGHADEVLAGVKALVAGEPVRGRASAPGDKPTKKASAGRKPTRRGPARRA